MTISRCHPCNEKPYGFSGKRGLKHHLQCRHSDKRCEIKRLLSQQLAKQSRGGLGNETMNTENFIKTMRSAGVPRFLKINKLKMLQDNARLQTSAPWRTSWRRRIWKWSLHWQFHQIWWWWIGLTGRYWCCHYSKDCSQAQTFPY